MLGSGAVPSLGAARGPDGDQVEVLRFDRTHERVRLGPHRHRDLELMYFERGGGTDRLGDRTFDLEDGDVLLVAPAVVHDAAGIGEAAGWSVEFNPQVLGLNAPGSGQDDLSLGRLWWANPLLAPFVAAGRRPASARFRAGPAEQQRWSGHLAVMHEEYTHRREGHREMVRAYLQIILVALTRLVADHPGALQQHGEPALARVFEVVEREYARPLSTSDVAGAVGLTPGYLTTLVRERTGRTVGEWILERRMAAARDLLGATNLSAEQIAAEVGYGDPAYFSRRFRRSHGVPPGVWRARNRR